MVDSRGHSLDRPDGYQFKAGELVKVFCGETNKYKYYYVLEDNRNKRSSTYTYTLAPVIDERDDFENNGYNVYCFYPNGIETCSKAEYILYSSKNNFFLKNWIGFE